MRGIALLVVACGCDGVLGLAPTELADAHPPDAPRTCGSGLPTFTADLHQVPSGTAVFDYTIAPDANRALATADSGKVVLEGDLGAALAPASGLPTAITARIDPEGDSALVFDLTAFVVTRFSRAGDGTWSAVAPVPALIDPTYLTGEFSASSRAPRRRVLVARFDGGLDELASSDGIAWTPFATYTMAILGVGSAVVAKPTLTADGLRGMFQSADNGQAVVRYIQRSSIDVPFSGPATVLDSLTSYAPATGFYYVTGYLTENCNRFYFAVPELSQVFFVEQ